MDREDIIRMAREAGCHDNGEEFRFVELHYLERFAALVVEACAQIADEVGDDDEDCHAWTAADAIRARSNP